MGVVADLFGKAIPPHLELLPLPESPNEKQARRNKENSADRPAFYRDGQEVPGSGGNNVDKSHGQHELPREIHELVHAKAGQRASNPDEATDQDEKLREEPDVGRDPCEE